MSQERYKIVVSERGGMWKESLEELVEREMELGWTPIGGPFQLGNEFAQAMIKAKTESWMER